MLQTFRWRQFDWMPVRESYPSDVSDDEWELVAPYLTLLPEQAGQRADSLREVFNAPRYLMRYGVAWQAMPNDLPPWHAVYDQARHWLRGGCFEALVHGLRAVLRLAKGRAEEPSAAVLDSRMLRSTPESGSRAAWDGHKRTRGLWLHMAVDTLGHLLALRVKPATADNRSEVAALAEAVQDTTNENVDLAYVDQGYTGERPAQAAAKRGIALGVVRPTEAKRGFVLLRRRWVVEPSFGWRARFRRLFATTSACPKPSPGCILSPSSYCCSGAPNTSPSGLNSL